MRNEILSKVGKFYVSTRSIFTGPVKFYKVNVKFVMCYTCAKHYFFLNKLCDASFLPSQQLTKCIM